LEVAAHQMVTPRWGLNETYSFYTEQYDLGMDNVVNGPSLMKGTTPRHQASLSSSWNVDKKFELNLAGYYTSQLQSEGIAPYARLDAMGIWKPNTSTQVSFGIQNLTNTQHLEAPTILYDVPSFIPRSAYARVTLKF